MRSWLSSIARTPDPSHSGLWLLPVLLLIFWTLYLRMSQPLPPLGSSSSPPPQLTQAALTSQHKRVLPGSALAIEQPLTLSESASLQQLFEQLTYQWPLSGQAPLPTFYLQRLPKDLSKLDSATRKKLFFRLLLPLVVAENQRIETTRTWLVDKFMTGPIEPASSDGQAIQQLLSDYKVSGAINDLTVQTELLRRVDGIPVGLVLAQAALESGWGSSRFSQEGNNLFGIWSWNGEGLVPFNRPSGATHRVMVYDNLRGSIRHYLLTLNSANPYHRLRHLRAYQRLSQQPLDPELLAAGLRHYSARGELYIADIRRLIRTAQLGRLPQTFSWINPNAIASCTSSTNLTLPPAKCS